MRRSVGRFQIEREAGTGGVGTVYRARDPETGQVVAVKVIRGVVDADLKRFAREARILAQIRHRGVVRYIEHGVDAPGEAYLVMEWLDGEDLRDRLGRQGLSLAESLSLGLRAAEALGTIHAHGLIHRDIKPGNVFLPGGVVSDLKIIDFGLARGDGSLGPTQTGVIIGTPSYMAPEQARGERGIDARADLYSLGCVLFKAITGRVPFPGQELVAVLSKVLGEEPPRVRELRPEVPAALDDLLGRLLAKDREARPESAAAVVEALSALAPSGARDRPQGMPPSAIMAGEQRRVVMLLVGGTPGEEAFAARIREHGGQLDRLRDGTRVVVFAGGWALASDQATRAARCALALHELAPTTPMVLATFASEVGGQLLVGAAVDEASATLRRAAEREAKIAVDALTAALLDGRFDVRSGEGGLTLHGLRELDSGARRLLGRETPFVGRDWELSSILGLLDRAVDDELALALVVTAPAGVGKTRLGREVVRAVVERRPEVEVWTGRADPLRARSALELLAQILRGAAGLRDGDPPASLGERLERRLAQSLPPADALRVAQFLGEIVGLPLPDDGGHDGGPSEGPPNPPGHDGGPSEGPPNSPGPELRAARQDPRLMAEQTQRAFRDFVGAVWSRAPGLVVIEDLQWADLATLRFLDDALAAHARLPWMVLALARPELATLYPRLWKDRNVQEIRLKPLPRRASERLVREVLGERVAAETAARLAARADGNAFYLEELIRAEAARVGPVGTLPETVLAMVQTRLEGLDPDERRALRAASVFGEVFWPGGVAALLGGSPVTLGDLRGSPKPQPGEGWIDALLGREILVRRRDGRFAGETEVAFRHTLLREGAYAMLTDRDRVAGHRLAGEWLLAHGEVDPVVLSRHFDLGGDPARAGGFHLGAAERALRGADVEAALGEAERALASGISGEPLHVGLGVRCEAHAWRTEWDQVARYAAQVMLPRRARHHPLDPRRHRPARRRVQPRRPRGADGGALHPDGRRPDPGGRDDRRPLPLGRRLRVLDPRPVHPGGRPRPPARRAPRPHRRRRRRRRLGPPGPHLARRVEARRSRRRAPPERRRAPELRGGGRPAQRPARGDLRRDGAVEPGPLRRGGGRPPERRPRRRRAPRGADDRLPPGPRPDRPRRARRGARDPRAPPRGRRRREPTAAVRTAEALWLQGEIAARAGDLEGGLPRPRRGRAPRAPRGLP